MEKHAKIDKFHCNFTFQNAIFFRLRRAKHNNFLCIPPSKIQFSACGGLFLQYHPAAGEKILTIRDHKITIYSGKMARRRRENFYNLRSQNHDLQWEIAPVVQPSGGDPISNPIIPSNNPIRLLATQFNHPSTQFNHPVHSQHLGLSKNSMVFP